MLLTEPAAHVLKNLRVVTSQGGKEFTPFYLTTKLLLGSG